jgi:hypothetical protein
MRSAGGSTPSSSHGTFVFFGARLLTPKLLAQHRDHSIDLAYARHGGRLGHKHSLLIVD